ncbi:MAG: hypothetical protein K6U03_01980 [Firmicutes bacterium]|nr:hypothetical protein [Bacillota bacterium]
MAALALRDYLRDRGLLLGRGNKGPPRGGFLGKGKGSRKISRSEIIGENLHEPLFAPFAASREIDLKNLNHTKPPGQIPFTQKKAFAEPPREKAFMLSMNSFPGSASGHLALRIPAECAPGFSVMKH